MKWDGVRAVVTSAGPGRAAGPHPQRPRGRGHVPRDRRPRRVARAAPDWSSTARSWRWTRADGLTSACSSNACTSPVRPRSRTLVDAVPVSVLVFDLLYRRCDLLLDRPYTAPRELLESLDLEATALGGAAGLRRGRRRSARDQPGAPARGRGRQAAGLALRAGAAVAPLGEGQARAHAGGGRRRLAAGRGTAVGHHRVAAGRRAGAGGGLRTAGTSGTGFTDAVLDELDRLLAPLRAPSSPFADRGSAGGRARRGVGRAACSSARWPTASGRGTAGCGTRAGADCARTSPPPTWCASPDSGATTQGDDRGDGGPRRPSSRTARPRAAGRRPAGSPATATRSAKRPGATGRAVVPAQQLGRA